MNFPEDGSGLFPLMLAVAAPLMGALILVPALVRLDEKQHLMARPNGRSSHSTAISNIGGVAIFLSVLLGALPLSTSMGHESVFLLIAFCFLFIIGIKDDMLESGPYFKLGAQVIAALLVVFGAGLRIGDLYGLFGISQLPEAAAVAITVLFILTVINSVNFIDGIDGLAASIGILGFVTSGVLFYLLGNTFFYLLAFSLSSALVGFLRYNLSKRRKVFMGDTGSMLIGMAFSVTIIKLMEGHAFEGNGQLQLTPLWALSLVIVPLFDFFRVFLIRVSNGRSPMRPDRNHIHHIIVDQYKLSHKATSLTLALFSGAFILMAGIFGGGANANEVFVFYALCFIGYVVTLRLLQKAAMAKVEIQLPVQQENEPAYSNAISDIRLPLPYEKITSKDRHENYA